MNQTSQLPPRIAVKMDDCTFWLTARRAAIMLAYALRDRYGFIGLVILLKGKDE